MIQIGNADSLPVQKMVKYFFLFLLLIPFYSRATLSIGAGTSSFTYGRAAPSLNLAFESDSKWSFEYQSEGVQTTVYSQNAWTLAGYKTLQETKSGILGATIGAGLGASYIMSTYRTSPTATTEKNYDYVVGPYLSAKFNIGIFFIGFNTLLGLTSEIQQHIFLNYQELSHVTLGVSL